MANIYLKNHPRTNITDHDNQNLAEESFGESFDRYYSMNFDKIHGLHNNNGCDTIREIPISNLGIADMISISWRLNSKRLSKLKKAEGSLSDYTL